MKYEKTWREIIPQMKETAYEDSKRRYYSNEDCHIFGEAFCYFRGVTPEVFAGLDKIMTANNIRNGTLRKPDAKTVYKVVISVDYARDFLDSWYLEPVTE